MRITVTLYFEDDKLGIRNIFSIILIIKQCRTLACSNDNINTILISYIESLSNKRVSICFAINFLLIK